jgi:sucrose-6-phosphate hydrolase SacC (GH32 family)
MNVTMMLSVFLAAATGQLFPPELVEFTPFGHNPVFQGAGPGHWDEAIRERGWILREDGLYHLWYTGYRFPESNAKSLGYATSTDGIHWERYSGNPIFSGVWTEDMMIVKVDATYHMFAEGVNDEAHMLTSTDRIHWTEKGKLRITKKNGEPIRSGPFGTPTAFHENGTWYLFYERNDAAVWLATSKNLDVWTNVQDEPVLERGPGAYDQAMIALDQIVKYGGYYYAYYHGLVPNSKPKNWTTNIAVSPDLLHWTKYPKNPILDKDRSSGVLVEDGAQFRLYTMHPVVCLYLPHVPSGERSPSAK